MCANWKICCLNSSILFIQALDLKWTFPRLSFIPIQHNAMFLRFPYFVIWQMSSEIRCVEAVGGVKMNFHAAAKNGTLKVFVLTSSEFCSWKVPSMCMNWFWSSFRYLRCVGCFFGSTAKIFSIPLSVTSNQNFWRSIKSAESFIYEKQMTDWMWFGKKKQGKKTKKTKQKRPRVTRL